MLPAQQTFPCQLSARLTIWCCGERTQSHARELPGRATSSSVRLPTNLHVQCRKGGTPIRCCVSLPGWVNTSNKRLKVGASFPGFYFYSNHTLGEAPPADTADHHLWQSLPAKNLPFPSCGRRVSPIQAASCHLQSGHGECLPATQLYLSVFTCPTVSLNLPLDAGESLPARQHYLFHPTAGETYPSRPRVFSSRRMSARASRPHILHFMSLPVQRSESWTPVGRRRGAPGQTILLLCLYLSNAASLDLPLDAGEVLPARQSYFLCLYLSNTASPGISLDAGEVLPARQSYFSCLYLSNTASLNLPLDAGEVLSARQSYFSCLYLSNTGVSISRWTPARCSRPDKRSSVCSHQKYRTPSNATYPAVLAILAFSPPPARFDHPAHKYQSHVRCRKNLPAGQPHLFLLRQRS